MKHIYRFIQIPLFLLLVPVFCALPEQKNPGSRLETEMSSGLPTSRQREEQAPTGSSEPVATPVAHSPDRYTLNPDGITFPPGKKSILVQKNGRYFAYIQSQGLGLINSSGELITVFPEEVMHVEGFSHGLSPFLHKKSRKWGYVNKDGKVVIPAQYDSAGPFAENGLAVIKKGKLYGAINRSGTTVIDSKFDHIQDFRHHRYTFARKQGQKNYSVLTIDGTALAPAFSRSDVSFGIGSYPWLVKQAFDAERILVQKGSLFGYKNLQGKMIIPAKYEKAWQFRYGVARVAVRKSKSGPYVYGAIDPSGKEVVPANHPHLSTAWPDDFSPDEDPDEVTIAGINAQKQCVIYNLQGKPVFGPTSTIEGRPCMYIAPFQEGRARVRLRASSHVPRHPTLWQAVTTFIDDSGKIVAEEHPIVVEAMNRQGLALYCNYDPSVLGTFFDSSGAAKKAEEMRKNSPEECGLINNRGEKVVQFQGKLASAPIGLGVYEGLDNSPVTTLARRTIHIKSKSATRIISDMGAVLTKKPFSGWIEHEATLAPFCHNDSREDRCGYISLKTGQVAIPESFRNAGHYRDGVAVVAIRVVKKKDL